MIEIIQATGYAPIAVEYDGVWCGQQMLQGDRRGVGISVYRAGTQGQWWGVLHYLTTWPSERRFTRVFAGLEADDIADHLRKAAKTVLPPGAGYPAMPQYESRQAKLEGMLEVATLTALGEVLADIAKA